MAVGTGIGFDYTKLSKAFDDLDAKLKALTAEGKNFETTMKNAFANMSKGDFKTFAEKVGALKKDVVAFGKQKIGLQWDSRSLQEYINDVNRLILVIREIQKDKGKHELTGTGVSIQGLKKELKDAQELLRIVKQVEKEVAAKTKDKNQTYAGAMAYSANAKTMEQERQAIVNLEAARAKLNKTDANYANKLNALNEAIQRHEKSLKDATKTDKQRADEAAANAKKIADAQAKYDSISRRERYKSYTTSYEGAIRTSDRAKTIAQEIQAVKNLEAARAKLNKTSADYDKKIANINNRIKKHNENIDKATKGAKKLREEHQSLGQAAGGLGRMLASAFSIQAIRGYINQMIKVRGEFELQQRSLQAILQNKDAADELWQKTIDLAVRSPFRVKELVTYTKQLAAYRIESDKLFETNKMLADVSAGLGVDMSRLILAFGQVRSASFLRGTELRQFTEAGIPMLEELAKYFTELEGRAVSVGDVFERISKRMVSFADVEEVFKRITSEGGTFYRMQEIQAETLQGQISNLKDSIDIMLNDMGKSYDSTLKNMVSLTKSLVDNWRTVSSIAIPIVGSLVARWGIFKIATTKNAEAIAGFAKTFGRHFGVVITQLTRGTRVAKQFAKSTQVSIMGGWTTVILAVVAALTILVKTIQNANRVKRELEKIDLSGAFDASRSVAEYKRLADVVSDTSKSYDEQQKALSTLKAKYQDILPSHLLEQDTIKALKGNYEEATTAIYDYIAAKTKEKQIEVIQTEYGSDVEEQAGDLADDIRKALTKVAPNITRADVLPIVNKLQELIQLGDVNILNVDEVIQSLVRQFTGLEISADAWKYTFSAMNGEMVTLENNAESLVIAMSKMKRAMNEVTSSSLNWQDSFIYQDFNRVKEGYEEQSAAIGKYYETIRKYEREREEKGESEVAGELKRDYEAAVEALNKIFDEASQKAPEWSAIINEPFKLNEATINANKLLWQKMIAGINAMPVLPSKTGAKQNYVELLEEQMEGFAGTKKQQKVARVAQDLANTMRVSLEGLDELFLKSDESLSDYAKRISGTLEQYKTGILQFDTDIQNGTKFGDYTKDQVDLMRSQVPFLEEFLKLFAAFLTPKKPTTTEDTFTPMLRSVKEIYSEFKKLQSSFDDLTAKEGALAKFGDAFKEAFGKTPEQMGFDLFSEEGVKAAYDYLISKAPDAKKKIQAQLAKGEIVWDVKLQTKKDADKQLLDDIQNMFDQYDLSLELKKLNIPPDLAKSLFGIESITLADIRKKVQGELDSAKAAGGQEDRIAQLEKDLEKIDDMEDKAAKERMKTYVKYLQEGMNERVKLKIEELSRLKDIEDSEYSEEQKRRIKQGVSKEAKKAQQKQEWEDFKGTEMYTMMFEDLEFLGTKSLEVLKGKLEELKRSLSDLDASEVKEIIGQINKIEDVMIARSPFKYMKELKAQLKTMKSEEEYQFTLINAQKQEQEAQEVINVIDTVQGAMDRLGVVEAYKVIDEDTLQEYMKLSLEAVKQGKTLKDIRKEKEGIVENAQKEGQEATDNLNTYKQVDKTLQEQISAWNEIGGKIGDVFNASKEIMESLGVGTDSVAMSLVESGQAMTSLIVSAITFGKRMKIMGYETNMALGVIGWVAIGVQAIATVLTAIANYNNAKIDDQLEQQAKKIERQRDLYEQLEEKVDSAYDVAQLRQYNNEMKRNIDLEIQALQASIALERSRKKADEDQIADWQKEIEEARERLAESTQDMMEELGGVFDLTDFTSSFVDAWWDAMDEGKSGLDALGQHFEDTMKDMVKKQALYQGANAIMKQVQDAINKSLEGDYSIDQGEWDTILAAAKKANVDLDAFLQGYRDLFGTISDSAGGSLSELQKGIQGITASQADILAAYWNSVRGYTASIDSKMDLVLANMGVGAENNPMLEQLISQTSWLSKIHGILEDVASASPRTFKTALI